MAEDNRFGLSRLRNGIASRYEQLANDGSEDADFKSLDDADHQDDGPMQPFTYQQEDFDRTEPAKDDMRKYWRQYETTPIVRKPISSFASQVLEPGYYIESDDLTDEEKEEIRHWLERSAIVEGIPGKDFRLLAKKAIVQREVRGTAIIEKAPDYEDKDLVAGLKLVNPETMEAVTRPGQSILLAPEDVDELSDEDDDIPTTQDGDAAAYLQDISETDNIFGTPIRENRVKNTEETYKIAFRRDEIIKLTRDADVGEIFGTSRVEAVSDRIEGLKHKLQDNDEAIASKAYPLWLFKFGTQDEPWDSSDIQSFMSAHEMDNFHPGMKQGVRGDVEVDTVSGEVAEIAEYLDFDIDYIISAMPMPKFAVGAFDSSTSRMGAVAQQRDIFRQIQEARRELENEFTPLIREVARQHGVDEERSKNVKLRIGKEGEEEVPLASNEQVIRYISGANNNQQQGQLPQQQNQQGNQDSQDEGENPLGINPDEETPGVKIETGNSGESENSSAWDNDTSVAELQMSDPTHRQLSDAIYETLRRARDNSLDDFTDKYSSNESLAVRQFADIANSNVDRAIRTTSLRSKAKRAIREQVASVNEEHGSGSKFTSQLNVNHFSENAENAVRDALEDLMRRMRTHVRRGAEDGDDAGNITARLNSKYDDANLRERADLIAHMELKNAVETSKLQAFEGNDDIVGVRVVNDDPSTRLTESLSGVEVYFDEADSLSEKLMEHTREEYLHQGFDPLPEVPPYHFSDTTSLEPIHAKQ